MRKKGFVDQFVVVNDGEERVKLFFRCNIPKGDDCEASILLLHGWLANSDHWSVQLEELERMNEDILKKNRIILLDLRGHGRSFKPNKPESFTHKMFSSDILSVLDALEVDKVVLWGYSLGSKESFHFLSNHPERVKGLILGGFSPNSRMKPATVEFLKKLVSEEGKMENHLLKNGIGLWNESEITNFYNQRSMIAFVDSLKQGIGSNEISNQVLDVILKYEIPSFIYTGEKDTIYSDFVRLSKEWDEISSKSSKKNIVRFFVVKGDYDHLKTWKFSSLYISVINNFIVNL